MMMRKPVLGFAVIRHPLEEGGEQAPRLLAEGTEALRAAGLEVIPAPGPIEDIPSAIAAGRLFYDERVPLIALAAATWSSDALLLDLLEECDVPIIAWAFPGMNTGSMCGCQQFACVLKEISKPYRFSYGSARDPEAIRAIVEYAKAVNVASELRKARFGLAGYRIGGMTEVAFDEIELKAVLGPRVIHYGLEEIEGAMGEISEDDARAAGRERLGRACKVSAAEADIIDSMRGCLALGRIAGRDGLSGIAVECYPRFMGRLCLAASLLADEEIVVGCEGDVNSTVAMWVLARLTGGPVHNTDGLGVDLDEGSIVFSHCGSGSLSLAPCPEAIEIARVRLINRGACALFPGKAGPVTLVNLVGRRGSYRMGVACGEAVPVGMVFAGNPTKVIIEGGARSYLDLIAREGLGHHWMIGYGDARGPLREFCAHIGIRCIER